MELYKTMSICCAHKLVLPYSSKCNNLHGHNYKIEIRIWDYINAVDENGLLVDFTDLKKVVNQFDHQFLNDYFNPSTVENFALMIKYELSQAFKIPANKISVKVWETDTCFAESTYRDNVGDLHSTVNEIKNNNKIGCCDKE